MMYLLFENNLLEPMELNEYLVKTQYYDKVSDFTNLDYNKKACIGYDKADDKNSDVESCYDDDDAENQQNDDSESECDGDDNNNEVKKELPF